MNSFIKSAATQERSSLAHQSQHIIIMSHSDWWTNEKPKKETSGPALRYLRSSNDFVYRQLADLDIPAIADTLYFKTYGWLLKLVALELHITTQAKQRSNQLRLITLLFKRSGAVSETFTNSMVQEKGSKDQFLTTSTFIPLDRPFCT